MTIEFTKPLVYVQMPAGKAKSKPVNRFVKQEISKRLVIQNVAEYLDLEEKLLHKKSRKEELVYARQLVYHILLKLNIVKKSFLGGVFGQDRTTALHSLNALYERQEINWEITADIKFLMDKIKTLMRAPMPATNES